MKYRLFFLIASTLTILTKAQSQDITNADVIESIKKMLDEEKPTVQFKLVQNKIEYFKLDIKGIKNDRDLKDNLPSKQKPVENKGELNIKKVNFTIHDGAIRQLEVICEDSNNTELRFYRDSPI
jgi:hypothetical protein